MKGSVAGLGVPHSMGSRGHWVPKMSASLAFVRSFLEEIQVWTLKLEDSGFPKITF
jgi:hypothetical protein